jgi:hypothetical protein
MFTEPQEWYQYRQVKNKTPVMSRQPYMGQPISQDTFEYDSMEYFSSRDEVNDRQRLTDLEPTIQDWSTEGLTEDIKESLVVNLEDLVNEEYFINHISEALHNKKSIRDYCKQWWSITDESSVKEMQVFFEEPLSKKLIKTQQILVWIFIGYIDSHEEIIYKSPKHWANLKNIINNLHRSYLVFIQFITWNLTEEQYEAAVDWAGKLSKVLEIRPVMKSYYNVHNSELLQNNNNISTSLIKDLLRSKTEVVEFKKESQHILRNIDSYEVRSVRDFIVASIQNSKQIKSKSTVKIKKSARLNQCSTQKVLHKAHDAIESDRHHYNPEFKDSKFNIKKALRFIDQESMQLTPRKDSLNNLNYNIFDRRITPKASLCQTENVPIINESINPLKTHAQQDKSNMLYMMHDSFNGDESRESANSESETPISKAPIPMTPEISNFPKFQQEITVDHISALENNSQLNETTTKYVINQEKHSQEESIDTFINTWGNKFFDTLNHKNNSNMLNSISKSHKVTPEKKSNFINSSYTPAQVFNKKYQIHRNTEKDMQMPYKSEQKHLMKKSVTDHKLLTEDHTISSNISKRNTYRKNTVMNNAITHTQTKRAIKTIMNPIQNQMNKKVVKDLNVSAIYKNEKPLKYKTPRAVKDSFDVTPDKNVVGCLKVYEPKTEARPKEKKVAIASPLRILINERKEDSKHEYTDHYSDADTISLDDTKNSPRRITKYDILNEYMTPRNLDTFKRVRSEENWNINQDRSKASKEVQQSFQSPLIKDQMKASMTAWKENKKLVESENSVDESQLNNIKLLRHLSVSKSKLPPSHMPDAHDKDSEPSPKLADKLLVINREVSVEDVIKSEPSHETPVPAPRFLIIDASEDELEELARIDAELSNANGYSTNSEEESTLVKH